MGVTGDQVMTHLKKISDISLENKDTGYRSLGSPGYEKAVEYVEGVMKDSGYSVKKQEFTVPDQKFGTVELKVNGKPLKRYIDDTTTPDAQFATVSNAEGTKSPLNDVPVTLPTDATYGDGKDGELGCEAADYPASVKNTIVLVSRGTCSFGQKIDLASKAGAAGVMIYNNEDGVLNATAGDRKEDNAPAVTLTQSEGKKLLEEISAAHGSTDPAAVPKADLTIDTTFTQVKTWNVIAETKAGDPDNVIMMGAHLDGVAEGPAVNDNASGTAGILAVAQAVAKQPTTPDRKVRFGFWGAEEVGLVGSTEYVNRLDKAEKSKIKAYLNYDMIGSNNFAISTLDANGDYRKIPDGVTVPKGSVELEKIYTDYFDSKKQKYIGSEFSGRSDYQAFMDAGIPVGGLDSGADEEKTAQEQKWFGGTAGKQLDTNYHQPSDTIGNVSKKSIDIIAPAMAFAAHSLAWDLRKAEPDPTQTVKRSLTVSPKELTAKQFVSNAGVKITATGLKAKEKATLKVTSSAKGVSSYTTSSTVSGGGTAVFTVRGLDTKNSSLYVGAYSVTVSSDSGSPLKGSFTVTDAASGGGDSDEPNGDSKDALPKTGSEVTSLMTLGGLLVAGGALLTVFAVRRRRS